MFSHICIPYGFWLPRCEDRVGVIIFPLRLLNVPSRYLCRNSHAGYRPLSHDLGLGIIELDFLYTFCRPAPNSPDLPICTSGKTGEGSATHNARQLSFFHMRTPYYRFHPHAPSTLVLLYTLNLRKWVPRNIVPSWPQA